MKLCTRCLTEKSRDAFRSRTGPKINKDGLNPTCRQCEKEVKREYDVRKKNENPLKLCCICNIGKHYTMFYPNKKSSYKDGYRCIDCIELLKIEKANGINGRKRVEHKDGQKKCSVCKIFKDYDQFWKDSHTTDGYYPSCISDTEINRGPRKEINKALTKQWAIDNEEYVREYAREYVKARKKRDPAYKLRCVVSSAIHNSIRKYEYTNYKIKRVVKAIFDHLPYTPEQLKKHLESLWEPWMNWDNYGKYDKFKNTWQIDHIIPQSKLIFVDFNDDNFKKLWSLSNLSPLDTIANIKKGNK